MGKRAQSGGSRWAWRHESPGAGVGVEEWGWIASADDRGPGSHVDCTQGAPSSTVWLLELGARWSTWNRQPQYLVHYGSRAAPW